MDDPRPAGPSAGSQDGWLGQDLITMAFRETQPPELPPLPRIMVNFAGAVARNTAAAFQGRLRVPAAEATRRAALCRECPFFRAVDRRCAHTACGCYLRIKVWLAAERCPIDKW